MKKHFSCFVILLALVVTLMLSACDLSFLETNTLKFKLNGDGESYSVVGIGNCTDESQGTEQ